MTQRIVCQKGPAPDEDGPEPLHHFECPVCEYDDIEGGADALAREDQVFCGLCAADNGREVRLVRWPALDGIDRTSARLAHQRCSEQPGGADDE